MDTKRKNLSKKIRFEVFKRDRFTCQYCGKSSPDVTLQVDHIIPVSKGGKNDMMNLVTACSDCNLGKGARELSDDSVIKKQQRELQEIATKKEQLIMLAEWREELRNIKETEVDKIRDAIKQVTGKTLSVKGRECFKKYLNKYCFQEVLDAIDIAFDKYYDGTDESINYAINKISGICWNRQNNDISNYYYCYLKKACNDKFCEFEREQLKDLSKCILNDEDWQEVRKVLNKSNNYSLFTTDSFNLLLEKREKENINET